MKRYLRKVEWVGTLHTRNFTCLSKIHELFPFSASVLHRMPLSFIAKKKARLWGPSICWEDSALCERRGVDGLLLISTHSGGSKHLCAVYMDDLCCSV